MERSRIDSSRARLVDRAPGARGPSSAFPTLAAQAVAARAALQQHAAHDTRLTLPGVAIWHWDLASGAVEWDEGLGLLFGYSERVTPSEWRAHLIHSEDRDRIVTSLERATMRNDGTWSERYRLRDATGTYTLVVDRAIILRDEAGPCAVVGALTRMAASLPQPTS